MKRFLILFLLSGSVNALAQGHLSVNQSLVVEITSTNAFRTDREGTLTVLRLGFGPDLLDSGDLLRLDFFEDSVNGPVLSSALSQPGIYTGHISSNNWDVFGPLCWGDRQGIIRFTMISGSIDILGVGGQATPNLNSYFLIDYIAIPEPSILALFSAALCLFAGYRYWPGRKERVELES